MILNSQGIIFTINVTTGSVTPALFAQGLTAVADLSFSNIIYQVVDQDTGIRETYMHSVKTGNEVSVPFNPFPEQFISDPSTTTLMYIRCTNFI